jgi:hypothetical protein
MIRRVLSAIPLAVLVACSGTETTGPRATAPSFAISDGAHAGGNPDAFFLPLLVLPTSSYSNWTPNGFNKSLSPTIVVCPLDVTTVAAVTPTTACKPAGGGFPLSIGGADVKKHFRTGSEPSSLPTNIEDLVSHYHAQWKIPNPCNIVYRLTLNVGDKTLGFADVQCVNNLGALLKVDFKKFGAGLRGTFLQIPFRIEQYALCEVPGVGPCGSTTVATNTGGETTVLLPGGTAPSGVTIPAQGTPTPGTPPELTVTVQPCDPLNPRATDIPVFGPCLRVTTSPALPPAGLAVAATVFVCDVQVIEGVHVLNHAQEHRITMHRLDEVGAVQTVTALPHISGCPVTTAAAPASLKGILRDLAQGNLKAAGGQVLSMIGPKPLYAARRLNLGAGGLTRGFSDFQVGLGCALSKPEDSGDGQTGAPGAQLADPATVECRDVGGDPVRGATVRFQASTGGLPNPEISVITDNDGRANTAWTLSSTPGLNSLTAKGRGLAGTDFNGPRGGNDTPTIVDPFQPIQAAFDDVTDPVDPNDLDEELVKTGSLSFSATGIFAVVEAFPFGASGYSYAFGGAGFDPSDAAVEGNKWYESAFSGSYWNGEGLTPFITGGIGAFGSGGCGAASIVTPWAIGNSEVPSDILLRKSFTTPNSGYIEVSILIDNDVRVWIDGTELTDGFVMHENCVTLSPPGPFYTSTVLPAGTHWLAVRGRDRGGDSYVDAKVRVIQSIPNF